MIVGQPRKMADWQVIELCQRWDSGEWTAVELQEAYNIKPPTLYRYVRRESPRAAALAPLTEPTPGQPDGRAHTRPEDPGYDTPTPRELTGRKRGKRDRATHRMRSRAPSYGLIPHDSD